MSRRNKQKRIKESGQNISDNTRDDYDLKRSLNKVNQSNNLFTSQTSSSISENRQIGTDLNSANLNENIQSETTSFYFKLHESFNSRYDSLNENIKNVDNRISDSSLNLRQELEGKLEDKLDTKFFLWAIAALVSIVVLIYTLSYASVIGDTKENSNSIRLISRDIQEIGDDIDDLNQNVRDVQTEQKNLSKEMMKKGTD